MTYNPPLSITLLSQDSEALRKAEQASSGGDKNPAGITSFFLQAQSYPINYHTGLQTQLRFHTVP